jgi:ferredoxin
MSDQKIPLHFVATREEAKLLIDDAQEFWVSNCGCREPKGGCPKSRMDICLDFQENGASGGGNYHKISRNVAEKLILLAEKKQLVPRPFRGFEDRSQIGGVCFCCDCCCSYFANFDADACDKGASIERTRSDDCVHCGACVSVCHFKARKMIADELKIISENCFGCGLCLDVCPASCIEMIKR